MKKIFIISLSLVLLAAGCSIPGLGKLTGGGGPAGGMLKSLDSGESWKAADKLAGEGTLAGVSIARLRIDPAHTDQLYVASPTSGLYSSNDKAETWKRLLAGPGLYDIQINPENSNELLAGGWVNNVAKVFKSTDAGQTWLEAFSESKPGSFVSALVYLTVPSKRLLLGLSTGEVIQSTNGGSSWNLLSRLKDRILRFEPSPDNQRQIYALQLRSGLAISRDGGGAWEEVGKESLPAVSYYDLRISRLSVQTMYLATSGGLYRSVNRGAGWQKLQLPLHEASTVVTSVAIDHRDLKNIFAVIGSTLYSSKDAGSSWKTKGMNNPVTVRDLQINPTDSTLMYAALGQPLR